MLILTVIYLGKKLPRYVSDNLEYLRTTFPNDDLYFISDSPRSIARANKIGIKTWLAPDVDEQWKDVRARMAHPMEFRGGFWFKTLARIFVLNSFMQLHPDQSVLQIEADVFLFPNFPLIKFKGLEADIAFPMESSKAGIASLLFLKNHVTSEQLMNIALREIEKNRELTDMLLLGKVALSHEMNFLPLPTLPSHMKSALNEPDAATLICSDTLNLSGVFDGISVGQYLLGIDPRNSRGSLILHRSQASHAINVDKLIINIDNNGNILLTHPEGDASVYNLHNHAKDLKLYKASTRKRLLEKRVNSSTQGESQEFVTAIFVLAVFKAIMRRVQNGLRRIKF